MEQLNKILLRFLEKQLVEFSIQPVDSKVKLFKLILKFTKCQTIGWIEILTGWNFKLFRKLIFFKKD